MYHLTKLLMLVCFVLVGCKAIQDPYVISGNTITYQHKSDIASINKASLDANKQCISLGYKTANVSHKSCSAGDCVTKYTCDQ